MKLAIPEKVLDQHLVVLGKTGAGKSSALRHIVEHLLAKQKRVCIIDPKGDWWGLKSSADGKGPGFPVIMFGDFKEPKAADVPINEHSGKHLAELIAMGNRPAVIGLRGWTQGAMTRLWIDFAETLFARNAGELYLVGDEFHNFAPKGRVLSPEAGKSLHWSNRLLSEGRGLGLVCLIASQRPQKVHNDTLTSCETLIAMRVVHAADRAAVKAWIDGNGDDALGKEVLNTLASLERGEAWAWSPEIGFGPARVKFPMFETFDSFAPPQLQKRVSERGWADVDLTAVKEKLAAVIQEEKANDPRELKAELAKLRAEMAKAQAHPVVAVVPDERVILRRIKTAVENAVRARDEDWEVTFHIRWQSLQSNICGAVNTATEPKIKPPPIDWVRIGEAQAASSPAPMQHAPRIPSPIKPLPRAATNRPAVMRVMGGDTHLSGAMRRILNAVAWWGAIGVDSPSRAQVGFVARIKPTGGHFSNSVGPLITGGMLENVGDGQVRMTGEGAAIAEAPAAAPTMEAYHDLIRQILPTGAQRRIFDAIVSVGDFERNVDAIATSAGIDSAGGHFSNSIGPLSTLGLIDRRGGMVRPTALLFPPSLA